MAEKVNMLISIKCNIPEEECLNGIPPEEFEDNFYEELKQETETTLTQIYGVAPVEVSKVEPKEKVNGDALVHEIVDEGFADSVTEQLVKHFGDTGKSAIYFRSVSDQPEVMLASTAPITDGIYAVWLKERDEEE